MPGVHATWYLNYSLLFFPVLLGLSDRNCCPMTRTPEMMGVNIGPASTVGDVRNSTHYARTVSYVRTKRYKLYNCSKGAGYIGQVL